jgi:cutinase
VNRLKAQAAACPKQTFSLVGYSQGAGVMHAAAKDIPITLYPRIKSLVMFGDGYHRLGDLLSRFPIGLNSKVKQVCAPGDPVRLHNPAQDPIH